jgi:electron transfer flavoprotein alpha subunit
MSILVIAEHDNANLKGATLNTVAAAKEIGSDITLLVAGSDTASVIGEAQQLNGITKILSCDNDLYKNYLAEESCCFISF